MQDSVKESLKVINTAGVHLRPAQLIASLASSYSECSVTATKDGKSVNAKSLMGITELVGSCGSEIEFEVCGPSASECLDRLRDLFSRGFDEEIDCSYTAN